MHQFRPRKSRGAGPVSDTLGDLCSGSSCGPVSGMEAWLESSLHWLLAELALPEVGLSAIFLVSLVSATLLPMGSEPAVFGYVKLAPHMFWPAILVATLGNTIGGAISYAMGAGAHKAYLRWKEKHPDGDDARAKAGGRWHDKIQPWLQDRGPVMLLFSWLPVVGDPLCAVAGWLRLSFWPSVVFMAIGKFLRYLLMTGALLWAFPGVA
ncbi:membrane protein YqaA with SNARE-associated domain [Paracandidimonas soli]|uniref:Membrane protein YqaA with SNARE-associated domain n=2 Tax=Paracandidimonas soli TaxID=1917182 RepID=A0A4R3VCK5_9BURK|nr:membrane protein YqaA with SNARE-associated domain [Paracandidimonas soli]